MKPYRFTELLNIILLNIVLFFPSCEPPLIIEEPVSETLIPKSNSTFPNTSFLSPATQIALEENETYTFSLSGQTIGAPSNADIVFMMDLTGSMRDALLRLQTETEEIIVGIQEVIPDARFGLVSHNDYSGIFSGCGITWKNKKGPNNPYSLNVPITNDTDEIIDKLTKLEIGQGGDPAESYSRVLSELVMDENLHWNKSGRKIVIAFLDNIPHDCNVYSLIGKEKNTGPDPGRDLITGTGDDLEFVETLKVLKRNNIILFPVFNGVNRDYFELWTKASKITGGYAIKVNTDGSLVGEGNLADHIKKVVRKHTNHIQNVSINTCSPEYNDWIVKVNPESIGNTPANNSPIQNYEVTLRVPKGTPSGIYSIDLCLKGDGAEYARTEVRVIVPEF